MIIVAALAGMLAGCLLSWIADRLPRFASPSNLTTSVATLSSWPRLACWRLLASPRFMMDTQHQAGDLWLQFGVELTSAAFFAFVWSQFGLSLDTLSLVGIYIYFLLIAIIDLKFRLVLNVLVYPAAIAVLMIQLVLLRQDPFTTIMGGGLAFAIFALTAWLNPGGLGGGDIKLATLIGFAFGFPQVLWALLAGVGAGAVAAFWLLAPRRRGEKSHIPYAPFLCLGAMLTLIINITDTVVLGV